MSHYAAFKTTMRDANFLVAALAQMGFTTERNATLMGFMDRADQAADVVVRKAEFQRVTGKYLLGDIGFDRGADGSYHMISDDYHGYMAAMKFSDRVNQSYAEQSKMAWAEQQGYMFCGREVVETAAGPEVKLLFSVRE